MLLYSSLMPPVKRSFSVNFDDYLFNAQEVSTMYQDAFKGDVVTTSGDVIGYMSDGLESWILSTGSWDDSGLWNDEAVWDEGV